MSSNSDSDSGDANWTPSKRNNKRRKKKMKRQKKQHLKYICSYQPNCDFRGTCFGHLCEHSRVHSDRRPYICLFGKEKGKRCAHRSKTQHDLMKHLKKVHFKNVSLDNFKGRTLPEKLGANMKIDEDELEEEAVEIDQWLQSERYRRLLCQPENSSYFARADAYFSFEKEVIILDDDDTQSSLTNAPEDLNLNSHQLANISQCALPASPSSLSLTSSSSAASSSSSSDNVEESFPFDSDDDEVDQTSINKEKDNLGPLVLRRTTHKKGSKYICQRPNCGKTVHDIMAHDRIHRKVNPYSCAFPGCAYKTVFKSNLVRHINRAHFKFKGSAARIKKLQRRYQCQPEKFITEDKEELELEKELFANAEKLYFLKSYHNLYQQRSEPNFNISTLSSKKKMMPKTKTHKLTKRKFDCCHSNYHARSETSIKNQKISSRKEDAQTQTTVTNSFSTFALSSLQPSSSGVFLFSNLESNNAAPTPITTTIRVASLVCGHCGKTNFASYCDYFQHDQTHFYPKKCIQLSTSSQGTQTFVFAGTCGLANVAH